MAFKVFTSAVLTAADVNDYLGEQAVIVCTSATRPTAQEGMTIYETDTDRLQVYDGTGWIKVYEPPQSWTPTYTNVTVGNATRSAYYQRSNGRLYFRETLILGSTSSVTGSITLTLPVAAAAANDLDGFGLVLTDASVNNYAGTTLGATTSTALFHAFNSSSTYATLTIANGTVPFTWGTGDYWTVSGNYRMTTLYS